MGVTLNNLFLDLHLNLDRFDLDIKLEVENFTSLGILGDSGAGKSSLVKAIIGLHNFKGKLIFNNQVYQDDSQKVAVEKRKIGVVFQEGRLFPHLTVRENIEFGKKYHDSFLNTDEVCEVLNIKELLNSLPQKLSGGEKQRVAIARAMIINPNLLIFDEPLASLDIKTKKIVLHYIKKIKAMYQIPSLYISHSLNEITGLCDQAILLEEGMVKKIGESQEVIDFYLKEHLDFFEN